MSSEVCPHCGKTYKRLKTHLPHCKAAARSVTPPTTQDVTTSQTPHKTTTTRQKLNETHSLTLRLRAEGKEVSASSKPPESPLLSSASSPSPAKKKKKQKVLDQIKTTALLSPSSLPLTPTFSKPKKQSLRALIEAAKLDHVRNESSSSKQKDSVTNASSADSEYKDESKQEGPKTKAVILDSNVGENATNPPAGDGFWTERQVETEESPAQTLFSKPGSGHQARVTLQDVKATLGRANAHRHSGRPSILSRLAAADRQGGTFGPSADLSSAPAEERNDGASLLAAPRSGAQLGSDGQRTELQLFHRKSKQPALILLQQDAARQVQQATPPPGKLSLSADHQVTRLPFSSVLFSSAAAQTLPGGVEELQLKVREGNAAEKPAGLGQVKLKDLPTWLASRTPRRPSEVVDLVQSGWRWYYGRYVNVKKGGVAGLSMLLAGYCVLSYIWSYPHIKLSRWRKYH
ncbi:uncharacterized protein si:dkey-21c1.4 [Kryptolebias marmoratus]|uniref:uncharacterized protein si:dkey-21c1.4 n=1 Tax=Kryptolebias marmoratus TaxID=37003 RepID=UPI0007F8D40D|nr:uncharacterized protein si:dkey-21c1.4 [Kryptolebias marmoratus]